MSRPISGNHSIEVANFVCVFGNAFPATSVQSLMTLQEIFKEEYPVFSTNTAWNFHIEGKDKAPVSTHQIAGVSLQNFNENTKKPAWVIKTEPQSIVISCFDYDRWEVVSKKALDNLITVINVVDDGRNPVTQVVLHVVDRFIGGPSESYKINQVFNTKSKFLSKQSIEAGPLWHVHQGWFEVLSDDSGKILHNLNLSTNDTPQGMITTIDHIVRYIYPNPVAASDVKNVDSAKDIFDRLHLLNKEILVDLLNKKQCRKIKLCQ